MSFCAVLFLIDLFCINYALNIKEDEIINNIQVYKIEDMYTYNKEEVKHTNKEKGVNKRISELQHEMKKISSITDRQQWFINYKNIIESYKDISSPVSIYDVFSDEEIILMLKTIETECYQADFISKVNVASVIINRIESGEYGDTVNEVITSPNQFVYHRDTITEDTRLALEYAYMIEDTTNGCVAFRSNKTKTIPQRWGEWELQFVDDIGHGFYL